MRNVQRTASCGDAIAHERVRKKETCRSNEKQSGAIALSVTAQVAFNSDPEAFFASGWETGAVLFFEVAQQVLLAQQLIGQLFCRAASERMQVRAET
jgi:hypothetical protein